MKYFFFLLFSFISLLPVFAFTDVPDQYEHADAIYALQKVGILQGYDDGSFRPENTINRAEAVKLMVLGGGINVNVNEKVPPFSDIEEGVWFIPYVTKAKSLGIIKGNDDGLFHASRETNLAEALKVVFLSHGVRVSLSLPSSVPYADVPVDAWYAPYFVQAKKYGIFDQKVYENIDPGHAVTRGELAEIIYKLRQVVKGEDQSLVLASFYADTLHGTKTESGEKYDKNLYTAAHRSLPLGSRVELTHAKTSLSVIVTINDRGPSNPDHDFLLSRAAFQAITSQSPGVVPLLYRVLDAQNILEEELVRKEECYQKEDRESYKDTYFYNEDESINITLYSDMYNAYFENEVFDISGKYIGEASYIRALIKDESGKVTEFFGAVKDEGFMIQVDMGGAGVKTLTLLPEGKNENYTASFEVTQQTCIIAATVFDGSAANIRFDIEDNDVIIRWDLQGANLSRLEFFQGGKIIRKYFSHSKHGWKVDYRQFQEFAFGEARFVVSVAESPDGNFGSRNTSWNSVQDSYKNLGKHFFRIQEEDDIVITSGQSRFQPGGEIIISGTTKSPVLSRAAIFTPGGDITYLSFETSSVKKTNEQGLEYYEAGMKFILRYSTSQKGAYVVDISHLNGYSIFSMPLYDESVAPVIPSYATFQYDPKFQGTVDLASLAASALSLLNDDRLAASESRLEIDAALSLLAQYRADVMIQENNFSHIDVSGKTVIDYKIEYGVKTSVAENFGRERGLELVYESIMRSAHFRENIFDSHWRNVGFGFGVTQDGQLLMVQVFSADSIEEKDIEGYRDELLNFLNSNRNKLFVPQASLTSVAQAWSDKMSTEEFFDFSDSEGVTLSAEIRKSGVLQTVGTFIAGNSEWNDLLRMVEEHSEVYEDKWRKMGIGISQDNNGIIKVTLLYSE
ncbi:hypothetical protein COB57_02570 [Candidatus Peregrinibacteria bacterium]|nr:MAG: hypothetical protein COB57_02570 [Candidatus Peregrinibacteria bacterium]